MVNENKSSCYPEKETYKQGVCSPYNELGTRKETEHSAKSIQCSAI